MQALDAHTLVRQLRSGKRVAQQEAAAAAQSLADGSSGGSPSELQAFVDAGGAEALAAVLCSGHASRAAKQAAVQALTACLPAAFPAAAVDVGAVLVATRAAGPLLQLISSAASSGSVRLLHSAMQLLRVIYESSSAGKAAAEAAGAIPALLSLLRRRCDNGTQAAALLALARLLHKSDTACAAAGRAGAGELLVGILRSTAGSAGDESESTLLQLAACNLAMACREPTCASAVVRSGGVPLLVRLLGAGEQTVLEATMALWNLAQQGHSYLQAVAAAGGIRQLVSSVRALDVCDAGCGILLLCCICEQLPECHQEVWAAGGVQALQRVEQAGRSAPADAFRSACWVLDCLLPERVQAEWQQEAAQEQEHEADLASASPAGAPTHQPPDGPAAAPAAPGPSRSRRMCAAPGCGATRDLKRCAGCYVTRYCSVECSRAHWPEHGAECRRLQAERAEGDAVTPRQP